MIPEELVQALEDLHRGYEAQLRLVFLGEAAVTPLARFLLGPPAAFTPSPGCWPRRPSASSGARERPKPWPPRSWRATS